MSMFTAQERQSIRECADKGHNWTDTIACMRCGCSAQDIEAGLRRQVNEARKAANVAMDMVRVLRAQVDR